MVNHGIIPGKLPSDWLAGAIPWENRNPSGDWRPYLVVGEHQSWGTFDCMACVSFATNNICEIQIKHQTGKEINKADRFLAKVSGTTQEGNRVSTVLDADDNCGFVYEPEWSTPATPTWTSYYASIPKTLLAEGIKNKVSYTLQYEYLLDPTAKILWTPEFLQHHLQHAPLLITIPGHEICAFKFDSLTNNFWVLDDYTFNIDPTAPFIREIPLSDVTDIYKAVVTVKNMSNTIFGHKTGTGEYGFWVPATTPEALKDKALNFGLEQIIKADGSIDFTQAKEINGL